MNYELEDKLTNYVYAETGGDRSVIRKTVKYLIRHGWVRQPAGSSTKLVDLGPRIAEATRKSLTSACHLAQLEALRWLDEHPEAVPSPSPAKPTITAGQRDHLTIAMTTAERNAFHEGLFAVGGEVVPDPVPTNVKRLESSIRAALPDYSETVAWEELARRLDKAGVTAPGGEE